jgi:hypothetical protein
MKYTLNIALYDVKANDEISNFLFNLNLKKIKIFLFLIKIQNCKTINEIINHLILNCNYSHKKYLKLI